MARTPPSEPITRAVHLCIDMQNILASGGLWATPWMDRVLPQIVSLVEQSSPRCAGHVSGLRGATSAPREASTCRRRHQHALMEANQEARREAALRPHLNPTYLKQKTVLFEVGDAIDSAYFLTNAVVSLVVTLATGEMTEAAMVGRTARPGSRASKLMFSSSKGR
jgi:hypothetical protein